MDEMIGKTKSELDTPCLVLDKNLLQANILTMQHEAKAAHKQVRPHAKTHKCIEICKLQIAAGASGISVAKISEALVLAEHGFKNTLITSPVITPHKINQLMRCLQQDPQLTVVVDNLENACALNFAAHSQKLMLAILIDIDPGIGRTGISAKEVVAFATALRQFSHLKLQGIQCYAGMLQHMSDYQARHDASNLVMDEAAKCKQTLNAAGFTCPILSGSGTGTYDIDLHIPEVTEIQPGSYTVMDAEYFSIGSASHANCNLKYQPALTLLTTIISTNQANHVTCDAGWKALYQVPTRPIVLSPAGYQYDWGGFGDEHGKITAIPQTSLPVLGDRLEMMVAHCDPTINMYDYFYVTENDKVVAVWPITMRGKSQ